MGDNPFAHDRVKTHQPNDLWEWLLKLAVFLFVLDVGVRRIQIDRDEWNRATQTLHKWIFFWRGTPRTAAAEESLATLLARREQIRSTRTGSGEEPRAELFRPQQPGAVVELPGQFPQSPAAATEAPPATEAKSAEAQKSTTTASRLLEAKKRAQKRRDG